MLTIINENPALAITLASILAISTIMSLKHNTAKIIPVVIIICMLFIYFYRMPDIHLHTGDNIYGPCFGTITSIIDIKGKDNSSVTKYITIFLSPMDIHHQFYPVNGVLESRIYDPNGKFELAFNLEKAQDNEKCIHVFKSNGNYIKMIQIAGKFVRRITFDDKEIGDEVINGERLGMIHFGSRVDMVIPDAYELNVKAGDYVTNNTLIAIKK